MSVHRERPEQKLDSRSGIGHINSIVNYIAEHPSDPEITNWQDPGKRGHRRPCQKNRFEDADEAEAARWKFEELRGEPCSTRWCDRCQAWHNYGVSEDI